MPDRTPAEVLRDARERITPEEAWTTREAAHDASGRPAPPQSPFAVAWCALGAIECEAGGSSDLYYLYHEAFWLLGRSSPAGCPPSVVNDLDGHTATLKMFDRAIALAEAE